MHYPVITTEPNVHNSDMKSGKAPGATNTMQQFKKSGNMRS